MSFDTAFAFYAGPRGRLRQRTAATPAAKPNTASAKRSLSGCRYPGVDAGAGQGHLLRDYWQAASCERMPPKIAIAVFDVAVHLPENRHQKLLQRAEGSRRQANTAASPGTMQSRDTSETLELLLAQRAIYLTTCPAWPTYKLGWLKRLFNLARSNFAWSPLLLGPLVDLVGKISRQGLA